MKVQQEFSCEIIIHVSSACPSIAHTMKSALFWVHWEVLGHFAYELDLLLCDFDIFSL
jgi:hypothetical protein